MINKIKAEIGRLKVSFRDNPSFRTVRSETAKEFADNLLSFIESLEKEQPQCENCGEFNGTDCPYWKNMMRPEGCIHYKREQPKGLDEAAEEIASDIAPTHPDIGWDECFDKIKDGIKAGVEWVAGQGVSMLGKVGIYGVDVESITKELREAGFNLGEEIVVQIRKK